PSRYWKLSYRCAGSVWAGASAITYCGYTVMVMTLLPPVTPRSAATAVLAPFGVSRLTEAAGVEGETSGVPEATGVAVPPATPPVDGVLASCPVSDWASLRSRPGTKTAMVAAAATATSVTATVVHGPRRRSGKRGGGPNP